MRRTAAQRPEMPRPAIWDIRVRRSVWPCPLPAHPARNRCLPHAARWNRRRLHQPTLLAQGGAMGFSVRADILFTGSPEDWDAGQQPAINQIWRSMALRVDQAPAAALCETGLAAAKYSPFTRIWHQQAKAEEATARLSPMARRLLELLSRVSEKKNRHTI